MLGSQLSRDVKAHARALLQIANHAEQVLGLRVAARSKDADQALGRRASRAPSFSKPTVTLM